MGVEEDFTDSVRSAEHSMAELLAAARGIDILDAYQLASHVADIRLGPIWPKFRGEKLSGIPIPMCVELSKEHFA